MRAEVITGGRPELPFPMRIESKLRGFDVEAIRRAIDGCPEANGYTLVVKPLRYRIEPHLAAMTVFEDQLITVQVPEPFLPFGEVVVYGSKRRPGTELRFVPLSAGVTFRTRDEVVRYLYLHEWFHWWLYSRGERFQRETACDRFALRGMRRSRRRGLSWRTVASLKVGAGLSTNIDASVALSEAVFEATTTFGDALPNLVICFITDDHRDAADEIATTLGARFPGAAVIGCTTSGVVSGPEELEHGPAVSVLIAFLPDTRVVPFGLRMLEDPEGDHAYEGWPEMLAPDAALVLLCDRFSFPAGHLAVHLNETRPGQLALGGVTAGGREPGDTRLFYAGRVFREGAVGVAIEGRVRLRPLVSQGCRPIGRPMTVTKADRNIIFELAGEKPIDAIRGLWSAADARDKRLMQEGLQLGRVVDEYRTEFGRGDFIIRPVMGADTQQGFIAVGDIVTVGETVQFHIRDPETADEDLQTRLDQLEFKPVGALLFACNGRGLSMFDQPDHDALQVTEAIRAPLAGMFCGGELGPVAGRNFLHGFTAAIALFEDTGG